MRGFAYTAVFVVAAGSVLFGLDFMSAPLTPMPEVKVAAQYLPPPPSARVTAPARTPEVRQIPSSAPATAPQTLQPPPVEIANAPATPVEAAPPPLCDVSACAAAYRSFRESDCTFNPSVGPRRLCTKGVPPASAAAAAGTPIAQARACNVAACERAYGSFNAADCTYQPYDGPRRVCEK